MNKPLNSLLLVLLAAPCAAFGSDPLSRAIEEVILQHQLRAQLLRPSASPAADRAERRVALTGQELADAYRAMSAPEPAAMIGVWRKVLRAASGSVSHPAPGTLEIARIADPVEPSRQGIAFSDGSKFRLVRTGWSAVKLGGDDCRANAAVNRMICTYHVKEHELHFGNPYLAQTIAAHDVYVLYERAE